MAARRDAVLANASLQVANLETSPARLLHPSVALRVLWGNLIGARHGGEATQAGAQG